MKALQPKGIRIRPSETAVGRIGKPMRRGKRRSKLPNRFKQRQKTKLRHPNTGRSAATLNRQRKKRQFGTRETSFFHRPLPCRTSTETNKRPSENIFQTAFSKYKRKPKEVSYTGNWFERIRGKNRAASSSTSLPLGLQNH